MLIPDPPKKQRFDCPVFSRALSRNSMSRIREAHPCRFHCNLYTYDLYKVPWLGGPVFISALGMKTNVSSLNSMSRIREGRTWRFIVICMYVIYIKCQDLVVQFSVVFWVGKVILVVRTACRVSEKVAHGGSFVICIYMTYIKRQDLVVQFSVVLWVGKLILVVWTARRESEKVAHGGFIVICIHVISPGF